MPTLNEITMNLEKILKSRGLPTHIRYYDEFTSYIDIGYDPEHKDHEWTVNVNYEDDENWNVGILAYPPLFDIADDDELDVEALQEHYNVDLSSVKLLGDNRVDWVQVAAVLIPELLKRVDNETDEDRHNRIMQIEEYGLYEMRIKINKDGDEIVINYRVVADDAASAQLDMLENNNVVDFKFTKFEPLDREPEEGEEWKPKGWTPDDIANEM